jgi:hypothetical protein
MLKLVLYYTLYYLSFLLIGYGAYCYDNNIGTIYISVGLGILLNIIGVFIYGKS